MNKRFKQWWSTIQQISTKGSYLTIPIIEYKIKDHDMLPEKSSSWSLHRFEVCLTSFSMCIFTLCCIQQEFLCLYHPNKKRPRHVTLEIQFMVIASIWTSFNLIFNVFIYVVLRPIRVLTKIDVCTILTVNNGCHRWSRS